MTLLISLALSHYFLSLIASRRTPAKAVIIVLCLLSIKAEAQNQPTFDFLPSQIQGTWQIEEIDFPAISAVGPEEAELFIGRRIEITNSQLDVFGYRCPVDRYQAELIDNRAGYFGERWLFSNDLKFPGLRKAPDFYPDWLHLDLSCADGSGAVFSKEESVFFCVAGEKMDGMGFEYFGGDFLVMSCDGPRYIMRRIME